MKLVLAKSVHRVAAAAVIAAAGVVVAAVIAVVAVVIANADPADIAVNSAFRFSFEPRWFRLARLFSYKLARV